MEHKKRQEIVYEKAVERLEKAAKNKILIAIANDTTEELDRLAEKQGTTRVDIIRRALALYMIADREISENPAKRRVSITQGDKILESFVLA